MIRARGVRFIQLVLSTVGTVCWAPRSRVFWRWQTKCLFSGRCQNSLPASIRHQFSLRTFKAHSASVFDFAMAIAIKMKKKKKTLPVAYPPNTARLGQFRNLRMCVRSNTTRPTRHPYLNHVTKMWLINTSIVISHDIIGSPNIGTMGHIYR